VKISRALVLSCFALASAAAYGQTLPPPDYAGQSYWFGPGPQGLSVTSTSQNSGGYGDMSTNGSNWSAGATGGPAFQAFEDFGTNGRLTFTVSSAVTVAPYIYVDGYFGLAATLTGLSTSGPINIGSSRLYVLHNTPLNINSFNFTNLTGVSGSTFDLACTFTLRNYANPGNFSSTQVVHSATAEHAYLNVDVSDDDGILEVDIARTITPVGAIRAGSYSGTGQFIVTSL